MADSSLDDFFAKKDKSKSKKKGSKSKFAAERPDDILAKKIDTESGERKPVEKKKSKKKDSSEQSKDDDGNVKKDYDEEWVDFEAETEADYTGLRIQNLQISKEEDDQQDNSNEDGEDGEDSDGREKRDTNKGPWSAAGRESTAPPVAAPPAPEIETKPEEQPDAEPEKTTGKYIPPYMRAGSGHAPSGGQMTHSEKLAAIRRRKNAPDVNNEIEFPTLSGGVQDSMMPREREYMSNRFETVRGSGHRQQDDPKARHQQLELGNKFQALGDN